MVLQIIMIHVVNDQKIYVKPLNIYETNKQHIRFNSDISIFRQLFQLNQLEEQYFKILKDA